jgi:predicted murein hydrolase (TIGR00659 family)
MIALLKDPFVLLAITFLLYFLSQWLQRKTGFLLLNPILVTITLLIVMCVSCEISYSEYHKSGQYIDFLLKPAVVALGVPLYQQLSNIKRQLLPLLISQFAGCIIGVISVVLVAKFLGASTPVILSLAPKSVTTPIAIEVTNALGGIPSLTAAVVVCTGLLGGILGFQVANFLRIKSPIAQGLSLGTASHAVGTSAAMNVSSRYGSFASLGLTINGILTALFTPLILELLGISI